MTSVITSMLLCYSPYHEDVDKNVDKDVLSVSQRDCTSSQTRAAGLLTLVENL